MAVERRTISVDSETYAEFIQLAESKGIKFSTWIQSKMREFVDDERFREEARRRGLTGK